ncbi:band 7 protein [Candidatus Parcubacteria bacterium]|nr:MAG: band 7 protein [Candidatus Parcubacteria bacterium]
MDKDKLLKNIPTLIFLFFVLTGLFKNLGLIIFIIILVYLSMSGFKGRFNLHKKFGNLHNFNNNHKNMSEAIDLNSIGAIKKIRRNFITALVVILLIWLFFASIVVVEAGTTGVYSLFGRVNEKELSSGFHLVIPLAKVTKMSIRTEEYTMSITRGEGNRVGADAITSLTKEGLNVDLDMTVLYKIEEEKASDIYTTVGMKEDIDDKIIRPSIRTSIRDVIAQYEAKDIYSEKRQEAASKIQDELSASLADRGIIIEDVLLRNVALPTNLANAIQEKLQAEQEAQKYDFILEKEKKEKERKIIEAEGQRDAQKIINESLSTNYLYYLYINDLKSREGTIYVPTSPDTGMPLFRSLGQ